MRSFLRRYLNWVQNSVFEGELTESEMLLVEDGIRERIDVDIDSTRIYILRSEKFLERKDIGVVKGEISTIL